MRTMRNILLGLVALTISISMLQAQDNNFQKKRKSGDNGWVSVGPGNMPGNILAIHVDINNSRKIYAGTAGGGLWVSINGGASWNRCTGYTGSVAVSAIAQDENGKLFIGTGEAHGLTDPGVESNIEDYGIRGNGVYTSTDGNNFSQIQGTEDWMFVNALAYNPADKKVYAATEDGLQEYSGGEFQVVPSETMMATSISIGKDGTILYASFARPNGDVRIKRSGESSFTSVCGTTDTKIPNDAGRISVAIAPSDPDVMYAYTVNPSGVASSGHFKGVYRSMDKGKTWSQIYKPGSYEGPTGHPTDAAGLGLYYNVIVVDPDVASKLYVGTTFLYEGEEITLADGETKTFTWQPCVYSQLNTLCYTRNALYIGTNKGIFVSENKGLSFKPINTYLSSMQAYSFSVGNQGQLAVGVRDRGTVYIDNPQNSLSQGKILPTMFNAGINSAFSSIKQEAIFYSAITGSIYRQASTYSDAQAPSQWYGTFIQLRRGDADISSHALKKELARWYRASNDRDQSRYSTPQYYHDKVSPIVFWESTNDLNSIDTIGYVADRRYNPNEKICVQSARNGYPIWIQNGMDTLYKDSTLYIQDIVTSRFFIGGGSYQEANTNIGASVYMTTKALDFNITIGEDWHCVFRTSDANEQVMELQVSNDGDHLFILTKKQGLSVLTNYSIYRVSGFDRYRKAEEMEVCKMVFDVNSGIGADNSNRMLINDTLLFGLQGENIFSMTLDPQDNNNLLYAGALGSSGTPRIRLITNALTATLDNVVSVNKTGDLPSIKLPVYTAIIEMNNDDIAFIGTEKGVYKTENFKSTNPSWSVYNTGIDVEVPVFKLGQQTKAFKTDTSVYYNKLGDEIQTVFPGVSNNGIIYAATHGLGMFIDKTYHTPLSDYNTGKKQIAEKSLKVYPNPTNGVITIEYALLSDEQVQLNIVDITGKVVLSNNIGNRYSGTHSEMLDCSNLSQGLYFVNLKTKTQNITSKIIVTE